MTQKTGTFEKTFQALIVFVKHFYDEITLLTVPLIHDWLSVAQGPCSACCQLYMAATTHFKSTRFCVTLYYALNTLIYNP